MRICVGCFDLLDNCWNVSLKATPPAVVLLITEKFQHEICYEKVKFALTFLLDLLVVCEYI
jgi:hypothetical protein